MAELFSAVLGLSFKSSFLILAVVLLRLVLKRAPRRIICALWLLAALRLCLPFSVESSLSLIPEMSAPTPAEQTEPIIREPVASAVPDLIAPQINYAPVSPVITTPSLEYSPAASAPTGAEHLPLSGEQVASVVWLCGLVLMLGYLVLSYLLLRRRVAEAVPGGRGVWKCAAVRSPFVLGLLRPRIYVSCAMSPEQARYVLAHERSHIARRDHWWKMLGFLILSVHWFNPLVWLGYVLLCRDIELACDERVIKSMDPEERRAYSLALLSCAVKASPLAACPLAFGEVGVKKRIKSVLSYKKPTVWVILTALLCAIAAGVLFLTDPRTSPFDCPDEALEAIYDHIEETYTEYELVDVSERNSLLYSFTYAIQQPFLSTPADSGQPEATPTPEYRSVEYTAYVYSLHGSWKTAVSFGSIPGHIMRGVPFDCPNEVWETINAYLDARSSSMEKAQPYYYTSRDSRYSDSIRLLEYGIDHVEKQNELLYSFKWTGKREWNEGDALYYRKTGERRSTTSERGYIFLIDGEWKIASAFQYIPAHILRGEDESVQIPEDSPAAYDCPDEVLDTYNRWTAARSVESGDRDTWNELSYRGDDAPELNDPLMFSADLLTDRLESVTRVNDSLYEFIHIYTSKYLDGEQGAQHFVGLIDGVWRVMLYDAVPDAIRGGIENCDRWTWDDQGNQTIIPAHSYTDPELPVEAHLMDKLKFYLPAMHTSGAYDLYLGVSGGVPIYYADGTLCGYMELNLAMTAEIENGEIISARAGSNHAGFISDFEAIDHSVPCAIAQYSDDSGGYYWYVIFAKPDAGLYYALKLDTGYFSREEAIRMARSVRFTADAFNSFDDDERMYWPIIDAYATALSQGMGPVDMRALGLNEAMGGGDEPLDSFGWAIEDLDGRDFPELLIGAQSFETGRGTPIYALYAVDAEYQVKEVFSSTQRSMYYYVSGKYFLHRESAGAGNGSETWNRFYGDYLTELDAAPDTKVYGIALTPFSGLTGYSSSYGVELTGTAPHADYWGYEEANYFIRSGGETSSIPVPRPADIARRAAEIINSGALEELSVAAFEARMADIRYGSEELYLASNNGESSIRIVSDEKGYYIELANESSLSRYRITDPEKLDEVRLLMYNAPQHVFLDWDDPAEYALSNGLALGMDYAEIVSIMGQPDSLEARHSADIDRSIYYLRYPGVATLCLIAELNAPAEEGTLWSAQIYTDSIHFGRLQDGQSRLSEVCTLYGINPVIIEPGSEYLPVLQNLSIPHDGYYDSAFALVPRDEALWEDGPPPCAVLLFRKGVLECVYLSPAVAADFRATVTAPQ